MDGNQTPATICAHCGLAIPGVRAFEPCPHCGRVYEPQDTNSAGGDALLVWRDHPPILVLLVAAAALFGLAYAEWSDGWWFWQDVVLGIVVLLFAVGKVSARLSGSADPGKHRLVNGRFERQPVNRDDE